MPGRRLAGANAVAISPDDRTVYVTSLLSNSVTAFARLSPDGGLAQIAESFGCIVLARADDFCTQGRAVAAPEGVAVSPGGDSLYVAAFGSGAVDAFARDRPSGGMTQLGGRRACVGARGRLGCTTGRSMRGTASVAVSPDGRHVYATAFASNAVTVFRRAG
jgi:DNA-binding beta-propeller fold protein YncE